MTFRTFSMSFGFFRYLRIIGAVRVGMPSTAFLNARATRSHAITISLYRQYSPIRSLYSKAENSPARKLVICWLCNLRITMIAVGFISPSWTICASRMLVLNSCIFSRSTAPKNPTSRANSRSIGSLDFLPAFSRSFLTISFSASTFSFGGIKPCPIIQSVASLKLYR